MFWKSLLLPSSGRKKVSPNNTAWRSEDSGLDVPILAHNGSDGSYLWIFTYLHKVQPFSSEVIPEPHVIEVRWYVNKDMIHDCIFILRNDFLHEEIEPVVYALRYWLRIKSMKNLTKHEEHKLHRKSSLQHKACISNIQFVIFILLPCMLLHSLFITNSCT